MRSAFDVSASQEEAEIDEAINKRAKADTWEEERERH